MEVRPRSSYASLQFKFGRRVGKINLYESIDQSPQIEHTTSQTITIPLKRSPGQENLPQWTMDKNRAIALLSLWVYHSRKARNREKKQEADIERRTGQPQSRATGGHIYLLGERNSCARQFIMWIFRGVMSNWVAIASPKPVIAPARVTQMEQSAAIGIFATVEFHQSLRQIRPPIVGFQCRVTPYFANSDNPFTSRTYGLSQFLGNPYPWSESPLQPPIESSSSQAQTPLALARGTDDTFYLGYRYPPDRQMALIHAQHLFSVFICQVAKLITQIGGSTFERITDVPDGGYGFLNNSVLARIAAIFVESGLGTEEEAYMCIVPGLAVAGLLPSLQ